MFVTLTDMPTWEYLSLRRISYNSRDESKWNVDDWPGEKSVDETLNHFGAKGWELVGVIRTPSRTWLTEIFYLKRADLG